MIGQPLAIDCVCDWKRQIFDRVRSPLLRSGCHMARRLFESGGNLGVRWAIVQTKRHFAISSVIPV